MKNLNLIALTLALGLGALGPAADSARAAAGGATLDDAQRVTDQLHLTTLMAKILDQQKALAERSIRQMMPKVHPEADPADVEKAVLKQTKTMDLIWASLDLNDLQNQMTQVYREVFTAAELHGIAEFYATPAGRAAIEKQPEIQEKIMQIMMPKIMQAVQQARQHAALPVRSVSN